MFAYPSGHAHVGHVRNYIIGDICARMKRMRGYNVLHPFGWDAFGLPAENAAIKTGTHPETSTLDNIAHMKGQLQRLGISYAWEREIATCLPEYYKFNQWIFLKMFERGLAYRKRSTVNWCPVDNTVLANEQVVDGACWRCGIGRRAAIARAVVLQDHRVRRRAARGPRHADGVARESRRDAAELDRPLRRRAAQVPGRRTRSDAHRGLHDAHRHDLRRDVRRCWRPSIRWSIASPPRARIRRRSASRCAKFRALDREARLTGAIEKEGFDTGRTARQPVHRRGGADLDRELRARRVRHRRDHGRARPTTSATSSSPASTACPIRIVVRSAETPATAADLTDATTNYGRLVDSGEYTGAEAPAVMTRMIADAEKRGIGTGEVQYRLKDWGISRQRYWGTPIPIIYCEKDGVVGVPVRAAAGRAAEGHARSRGRGDSPLAQVPEFVNVTCPKCGGPARRETDTMDTFVDSSWYFLRFCDPKNRELPFEHGGGRVLDAGRLLQRRRRARDPAPAVLAVLHAGPARRRPGHVRRAVQAPAHAGHGAQGRRRHVEVEGQRRRSGRRCCRSTAPTRCVCT